MGQQTAKQQWRQQDGRIRRQRRFQCMGPDWAQPKPKPKMPGRDYGHHSGKSWERRLQESRFDCAIRMRRAMADARRLALHPTNPEIEATVDAVFAQLGKVRYVGATRESERDRHRGAVGCTHIALGLVDADMRAMATRCGTRFDELRTRLAA